jgi:hypothetical protein
LGCWAIFVGALANLVLPGLAVQSVVYPDHSTVETDPVSFKGANGAAEAVHDARARRKTFGHGKHGGAESSSSHVLAAAEGAFVSLMSDSRPHGHRGETARLHIADKADESTNPKVVSVPRVTQTVATPVVATLASPNLLMAVDEGLPVRVSRQPENSSNMTVPASVATVLPAALNGSVRHVQPGEGTLPRLALSALNASGSGASTPATLHAVQMASYSAATVAEAGQLPGGSVPSAPFENILTDVVRVAEHTVSASAISAVAVSTSRGDSSGTDSLSVPRGLPSAIPSAGLPQSSSPITDAHRAEGSYELNASQTLNDSSAGEEVPGQSHMAVQATVAMPIAARDTLVSAMLLQAEPVEVLPVEGMPSHAATVLPVNASTSWAGCQREFPPLRRHGHAKHRMSLLLELALFMSGAFTLSIAFMRLRASAQGDGGGSARDADRSLTLCFCYVSNFLSGWMYELLLPGSRVFGRSLGGQAAMLPSEGISVSTAFPGLSLFSWIYSCEATVTLLGVFLAWALGHTRYVHIIRRNPLHVFILCFSARVLVCGWYAALTLLTDAPEPWRLLAGVATCQVIDGVADGLQIFFTYDFVAAVAQRAERPKCLLRLSTAGAAGIVLGRIVHCTGALAGGRLGAYIAPAILAAHAASLFLFMLAVRFPEDAGSLVQHEAGEQWHSEPGWFGWRDWVVGPAPESMPQAQGDDAGSATANAIIALRGTVLLVVMCACILVSALGLFLLADVEALTAFVIETHSFVSVCSVPALAAAVVGAALFGCFAIGISLPDHLGEVFAPVLGEASCSANSGQEVLYADPVLALAALPSLIRHSASARAQAVSGSSGSAPFNLQLWLLRTASVLACLGGVGAYVLAWMWPPPDSGATSAGMTAVFFAWALTAALSSMAALGGVLLLIGLSDGLAAQQAAASGCGPVGLSGFLAVRCAVAVVIRSMTSFDLVAPLVQATPENWMGDMSGPGSLGQFATHMVVALVVVELGIARPVRSWKTPASAQLRWGDRLTSGVDAIKAPEDAVKSNAWASLILNGES